MDIILGFLIMIVLGSVYSFLFDFSSRRAEKEKQERYGNIEKAHKKILAEIEKCPNPLVRREWKAQVETTIHSLLRESGDTGYSPKDIKWVTTPAERRERRKAERTGQKYVHTLTRRQAEEIADEMVADFISETGKTRKHFARNFPLLSDALAESYAKWCDIDIKDARFAVDQIQSALNTYKSVSAINKESAYVMNGVEMIPVESSSVRSIGYDPEREKLYVAFSSGGTYEYDDVPANVYNSFMESPSKGRFVNKVLTVLYKYKPIYG